MKKVWLILFAVLMVFAGCRPKGILSSRQMQNVLYDLHRADAILRQYNLEYGHDEDLAKYYEVVLEKHGITQAQFDSSLVWYTDHPSRFDKIYPKIEKRCKADYDEIMKTLEAEAVVEEQEKNLPPYEDVIQRNLYGYSTDLWKEEKLAVEVPYRGEND